MVYTILDKTRNRDGVLQKNLNVVRFGFHGGDYEEGYPWDLMLCSLTDVCRFHRHGVNHSSCLKKSVNI
jgi:hypothetical protein